MNARLATGRYGCLRWIVNNVEGVRRGQFRTVGRSRSIAKQPRDNRRRMPTSRPNRRGWPSIGTSRTTTVDLPAALQGEPQGVPCLDHGVRSCSPMIPKQIRIEQNSHSLRLPPWPRQTATVSLLRLRRTIHPFFHPGFSWADLYERTLGLSTQ
jgi:hypothetical protein